jgi:hypothetical protein
MIQTALAAFVMKLCSLHGCTSVHLGSLHPLALVCTCKVASAAVQLCIPECVLLLSPSLPHPHHTHPHGMHCYPLIPNAQACPLRHAPWLLSFPFLPNSKVGSADDLDPSEWQVPPHCIPIHANVTTFDWTQLSAVASFDVVMMDPPWQLATANPTRGVSLGYSQLTGERWRGVIQAGLGGGGVNAPYLTVQYSAMQ